MKTGIWQMQASAAGDQCRVEISLYLHLGAWLKYRLQQGLQRRQALPAASEHAELLAWFE